MAITSGKDVKVKGNPEPVKHGGESDKVAGEALYAGGLVTLNGAGEIVNADASDGYVALGVAREDYASGATGVKWLSGTIAFKANGTIELVDIGSTAYAYDNETVTVSSNSCVVGTIVDIEGSDVFVKIG